MRNQNGPPAGYCLHFLAIYPPYSLAGRFAFKHSVYIYLPNKMQLNMNLIILFKLKYAIKNIYKKKKKKRKF